MPVRPAPARPASHARKPMHLFESSRKATARAILRKSGPVSSHLCGLATNPICMADMGLHPIDSRQVEMRHQASACSGDRMQHEIFCVTLAVRLSRSLSLRPTFSGRSAPPVRTCSSCRHDFPTWPRSIEAFARIKHRLGNVAARSGETLWRRRRGPRRHRAAGVREIPQARRICLQPARARPNSLVAFIAFRGTLRFAEWETAHEHDGSPAIASKRP